MRNIFTEIQDKAVVLITGKIRPEANAFDVGWSRKYSRGGYFLIGGLSGYITHSTVDMGQFIGGTHAVRTHPYAPTEGCRLL